MLLFSCSDSLEVETSSTGEAFFPLDLDIARIYTVEEIRYAITGFDTLRYQQRETIFDSTRAAGQEHYLMRVEQRENASDSWVSARLDLIIKTDEYLAIQEDGQTIIKLIFPFNINDTWNGNALRNDFELTYYYQPVQFSRVDSISFSDQVRVIIEDIEANPVNQDERSEIYAKGIGLVERDFTTLNFCTTGCNVVGEIESGRKLKQELIGIENE
ncbi:MAG: hypothetical protein AAF789_06535 [Bacteroidota bacterium]